jgi:hypothetical protein
MSVGSATISAVLSEGPICGPCGHRVSALWRRDVKELAALLPIPASHFRTCYVTWNAAVS